jgi:hypothetical protein
MVAIGRSVLSLERGIRAGMAVARRAVPELREARLGVDLVPQHDERLGVDDRRRAGDAQRAEAEAGRAADPARPPEQPFTFLGHRYRLAVTESQTRLCSQQLCEREDAGARSRLTSLYADIGSSTST